MFAATVDGAANIKLATRLLKFDRYWCIAHRVHLIVGDVISRDVYKKPLGIVADIVRKLNKSGQMRTKMKE